MRNLSMRWIKNVAGPALLLALPVIAAADPCGMVPPVLVLEDGSAPISRVGVQRTYVFHRDGIESLTLRPAFEGKVEEFGMLIPFPSPPSIQKAPDDVFDHIAKAIDPPEVVVHPRYEVLFSLGYSARPASDVAMEGRARKDELRVLKEEAVGMYDVAVLEAGSAAVLKRWMDANGFQYPTGMDAVCDEYIEDRWCFVAVKARVGAKSGVDPRPGMRAAEATFPEGGSFDGAVQAMTFRFFSEELVVPMRLSAFNPGELHNVVYLLAEEPMRIAQMDPSLVVRQVEGRALFRNVTRPLPLRMIGDQPFTEAQRQAYAAQRDPAPHNGLAARLFSADLLATRENRLANPFEEREKALLAVGERLGLRGPGLDALHAQALEHEIGAATEMALGDLRSMTLTVIDGDFDRATLAAENLRFEPFRMAEARNRPTFYDAKTGGPTPDPGGTVYYGSLLPEPPTAPPGSGPGGQPLLFAALGAGALGLFALLGRRVRPRATPTPARRLAPVGVHAGLALLTLGGMAAVGSVGEAHTEAVEPCRCIQEPAPERGVTPPQVDAAPAALLDPARRETALATYVGLGDAAVPFLLQLASGDHDLVARGYAVVALGEIRGEASAVALRRLQLAPDAPPLVQAWAGAARIGRAASLEELLVLATGLPANTALDELLGKRVAASVTGTDDDARTLIEASLELPRLVTALQEPILAQGPGALARVMTRAPSDELRRRAAGYLAAAGPRFGNDGVAAATVAAIRFQGGAEAPPWDTGGCAILYLPSVSWSQDLARAALAELLRWYVWAVDHDPAQVQVLRNNMQSVGLLRPAGVSLRWGDGTSAATELESWSQVVGAREVLLLLAEQDLQGDPRYAHLID